MILIAPRSLHAQIDIIAGEIIPITGPGDLVTLNQPENLVYTINVWGEDDRVIRGVNFISDNENVNPDGIPGYRHDWTHTVTNWQGKPEFGDTADDDEFEELMSDIRWTNNSPGNEFGVGSHLEVVANSLYTLQLLISGNHDENRIWDIFLDEKKVVDEFESNNYEPHDPGVVWAYTHTFIAPDDELNITFRQGETGGDGNAILQGIILAIAGEGVTPGDFNGDGAIDSADFQILLTNFHTDGAAFADGDINFDRTVDIHDFAEFRVVFAAANAANGAIVPEPGALLSFALGGAMLLGLYRYRRRLGYHRFLPVVMLAAYLSVLPTARADLIGYWPFEDDPAGKEVADLSGNGFNSVGSDSFGFTANGLRGAAGDFGDFNNSAFVLLAEEFATGDNGFNKIVESQEVTISYWLNRQGEPATDAWTFLFGSSRQLGSHAPWSNGNVYFDVAGCCGANQRINTGMGGADTDDGWHHLVYVKRKDEGEDKSVTAIFQDGALLVSSPGWDGTGAPTIDDVVAIDAASIGGDNNGGSSHNGLIDEFAIWDEALPLERIIALSEGGPVLPPMGLPGDFNGDEIVTVDDFNIMATNFGHRFAFDEAFSKGDYNGDLRVNLKDFLAFRLAFNEPAGAAASVPEPSSLALLGMVGGWLLVRRRRIVG